MEAAIVGGLIGGVGVVLGVLFGQSLQDHVATRARAIALARDVGTIGARLLDRFAPDGTLAKVGWGSDYYRFGAALAELLDCCELVVASVWSFPRRDRYRSAIRELELVSAMWTTVHVKLDQGGSLTEKEINALMIVFGSAGRVLRPGGSTDITGEIDKLRTRVQYFVEHGIDADPKVAGF